MILVHDTLSNCALEVYEFNQIALTVFNLQSGQIMDLVMLQGNNLKNKHARVMVLEQVNRADTK